MKISNCFKYTGISKIPGILKFLSPAIKQEGKIVIFAHHRKVMNHIEKFIKNNSQMGYIRIDGKTKQSERPPMIE